MAQLVNLDLWQLAIGGGLVVLVAILLWALQLRLAGSLLLAAARVMLQVLMLGILGTVIFQASQPLGVLAGIAVSILLVSIVTSNRLGQARFLPLIAGSLLLSTMLVLGYAQLAVIRTPLWYSPQYLIPLTGLLLASSPALILQVGQRFLQILKQEQGAIETRLSLGATASQAVAPYWRLVLQQSLAPLMQNLAVTGLITIPSLMAGLMLAGVPPLLAAAYQIVGSLLVIVHQMLTAVLVIQGLARLVFDREQSLP